MTTDQTAESVHIDGPCPFLTCLETGPHDHPICPECGAVRYGNIDCPTCQARTGPGGPDRRYFIRDFRRQSIDSRPDRPGPDSAAVDAIAEILRKPEWSGADDLQAIAEIVGAVRDIDSPPPTEREEGDLWRQSITPQ